MVLKAQLAFPFTPARSSCLILFLFFEHMSIPTWAKERAQIVNIVDLSVVGSGQCSYEEVKGWE